VATQDVLITGASRGIGRATALAFARRGARLAINYLGNRDSADETAATCRASGSPEVLVLQADVADGEQVRAMAAEVEQAFGKLDVVFSNAGYGAAGKLIELSEEDWSRAFAVHVNGAFHVCRATIPLLRKSDAASIVITSSVAGLRGLPKMITYGCVKGALLQFTRCLAWELADEGIRVNAICPGIIRTDFHASMTEEAKRHNLDNRIPLHREGHPDEVAQLVLHLVDNQYITGQEVVIDGGLTMRIP